jgi:peptidoglycan/LPS O-acetylase OafA/YrhL
VRLPQQDDNHFGLFRLAFAISVIFSHAFSAMSLKDPLQNLFHTVSIGEVAVDCFFILSGFLISMSWENSPSVPVFLSNRVLRIYPGFILAFVISVFVIGPIGALSLRAYFHGLNPVDLLRSVIILQSPITPRTFPHSNDPMINKALWTIHLEFICYLLLMGLGIAKILQRKWLVVALFAGVWAGFLIFRHTSASAGNGGAIYGNMGISLLRFLPMFLAGAVMYKTQWHRIRPGWLVAGAAGALLLGLCNRFTAEPAIATAGAYLMMVAGTSGAAPNAVRQMPDISYGIYLYGSLGLKLTGLIPAVIAPEENFALALIFAMSMGLLSWYAVERPALQLKKRFFFEKKKQKTFAQLDRAGFKA